MTEDNQPATKAQSKLYVRRLYAAAMVATGAFFLTEHIYRFGFEWWDIIGHEYLGLGLIIGGVLLAMRWKRGVEPGEIEIG